MSCLGCKIFQKVDVIVLNEILCNIKYLRDLECVIALNVFTFCCILGESKRALCNHHQVTIQGSWWIMPMNISYAINESNMVHLFHHLKAIILHLSSP